ncbi:hypothetical protein DUI87_31526 [Hirundo rustica rustica]|uniref:Uncharacterized protein n=1 Tax=Hirundo rustica rustica TaxID=333673 RepID=A0A3M0IT01_HIRRU|nr:hypothetical protein DUI87_31526 [Hirundo rustica rustica]
MPAWGRCSEEGPFLPGVPRFAVQVGMGRSRALPLSPDWAAIAGLSAGLLLLLAASLALALLCQSLGWARRSSSHPAFRRQQLGYNLDRYSSKIPAVFAVSKPHPSLQSEAGHSCSAAGTARFLRREDAWEPEGQIDLESFNTKVFFELLLRQSQAVTTTLGHFKEEVKTLYHRIMNEISSLKNLWMKALSIPGKGEDEESTVAKQQEPFPGSPLENPQASRFYGLSGVSSNPWEFIPQKLIPLLQAVLQMLEENRKNNFSPESPGYSSRSTLKSSAALTEGLKSEENQETIPASTAFPVVLPSPAERITHMQQEMQTRFLREKHSWERAHLEMSLLAREMGTVCSFYGSPRERHEGNGGLESRAGTLDSLLEELAERHSQAGRALLQRHLEEIKHSSLSPELAVPKEPQHFLDELPHQLAFCLLGLQRPNCDLSPQQKRPREVERSPGSVTRLLQVSGMKIVKLEALSQKCLYRVLDLYSHLQAGACPEGASRILSRFSCQNPGEEAAREVAESREQQQAARAVEFLREHHREGDLLKGLNAEAEAELRKMQAQFRLELQTRTEEKLKAKEMEAMQETEGQKFGDFVTYALLSQRHLRQRVMLLQDCHRLRNAALKSQKEGTGLEHLVLQDLSLDDDSRDILQLLEDNVEYLFLVLEFIQAARLLQQRETHFEEMIRSLKGCSQEKFVDDANTTTNEVKKFREQKMKKVKEQLKHFLEKKKTETVSSGFDPFQSLMKDCTERKSSLGKDFQLEPQKLRRRWGGDTRGKRQRDSPAPSPCTRNRQAPGTPPEAEDPLPLLLTRSIKVLKQAEHLLASRIALLNPQLAAPPLHGDERKCKNSSLLLGLLKEVNDELRSHMEAAGLGHSPKLEKTEMSAQEGELTAVDPAALSPREFVVFHYGLSVLQFLTFHIKAPEITLGVASSLPQSPAPGNAFRNSFFYQNSKKKLFILRDCLGSGGGFLLVLVHCLAHITAGDLSHDSSPLFLSLFHQALKACLSEMFCLRLQLPAAAQGDKSQGINQILLKEEPFTTEETNLISQLYEVRVKSPTDTEAFEKNLLLRVKSEESLNNRWLVKKKGDFLHPLSSSGRNSLGQRADLKEGAVNSLSPSELEDKVDALTEELVQVIEDEQQFLSTKGNEDLLSYYLEITTLEKESLVKQINALEEEIAQGRKL